MDGYHNADASDAAAAGFDYNHLHPGRIMEMSGDFSFIPGVTSTVICGCGFNATSIDTELVREAFDNHKCFGAVQPSDPWHVSVVKLVVNLVGWAAIAFVLHTLIVRLLER